MLLEAVFTTMQKLDALHSPRTIFTRLTTHEGKDITKFASRLRSTFYQLSKNERDSDYIRDAFIDIVKNGIPLVWTHIQPQMKENSTGEAVELLTQTARKISKWPINMGACTTTTSNRNDPVIALS